MRLWTLTSSSFVVDLALILAEALLGGMVEEDGRG